MTQQALPLKPHPSSEQPRHRPAPPRPVCQNLACQADLASTPLDGPFAITDYSHSNGTPNNSCAECVQWCASLQYDCVLLARFRNTNAAAPAA